jgi:N-acetylglucosaminyl-diphospho-decaprenol L-rhamnosyltransferase
MPENRGYGAAANAGAAKTVGEWLLILNGDIEIGPGQAERLKEIAVERRADLVAPAQKDPNGNPIPIVRNFPTPFTILFARRSPLGRLFGRWGGYLRPLPEKTEEIKGFVSGACFLVKKERFSEIGGFDPQFFLFSEDTDLCRRLAGRGGKILYTPEVTVKHFWGGSTGQDYHASLRRMHQSLLLYFKKYFAGRRLSRLFLAFLFMLDRVLARIYRPKR